MASLEKKIFKFSFQDIGLFNKTQIRKNNCFTHNLAESKFFFPLVFTKMLLSAKCPLLRIGHQFAYDFEHSLLYLALHPMVGNIILTFKNVIYKCINRSTDQMASLGKRKLAFFKELIYY